MNSVDSKSELSKLLSKNKKVLALFYSSWCPFCRSFLPSFQRKTEMANFDTILYIVVDDYDNPLWEEYSIDAVPTVILFERESVLKRLDGKLGRGLSEKEFTGWLREL
jgi:thioredoxin 1